MVTTHDLGYYTVSLADQVRVSVFCCVVIAIYWLALRWWIDRWLARAPRGAFDRRFRAWPVGAVFTSLALCGVGCMLYGLLVEPYRLTVTEYRIETPKIPRGEKVRLVHVADLHVRSYGPREKALPELVRSLHPDVILHSGDFFGKRDGVAPIVKDLLTSWNVPQIACEGNLDDLGPLDEIAKAAGLCVLNGTTERVDVRGIPLNVIGFVSGAEEMMPMILRGLPEDTFNIVLYHHPQGFPKTWGSHADLMLAGHTHGGQICLPWYGAVITMDWYGKRWESGRFDEHGVTLIVSRGIGCEPYVPEVRFWCPPEVIAIDLVGTGPARPQP